MYWELVIDIIFLGVYIVVCFLRVQLQRCCYKFLNGRDDVYLNFFILESVYFMLIGF